MTNTGRRALFASTLAAACSAPPSAGLAPASPPPEASEVVAPADSPDVEVPEDYAGVAALLAKVKDEQDPAARRRSYAAVRAALAKLTGGEGAPVVVAPTKDPRGRERTMLLPGSRYIEVARWGDSGLAVHGPRAIELGARALAVSGFGDATLYASEPTRFDGVSRIESLSGERRFAVAFREKDAIVIDAEAAVEAYRGDVGETVLVRAGDGSTRLLVKGAKEYEIRKLPSGEVVWSGPSPSAFDRRRQRLLVADTDFSNIHSPVGFLEVLRAADGTSERRLEMSVDAALSKVFLAADIAPDLSAVFYAAVEGDLRRLNLKTGADQRLAKRTDGLIWFSVAATADGKHGCPDPPGRAYPAPKAPPGASGRCYAEHGEHGRIGFVGAPPAGFRHATKESLVIMGFPSDATLEAMSPDGSVIAATAIGGPSDMLAPQTVRLVAYDAITGRALWDTPVQQGALVAELAEVSFSLDGSRVLYGDDVELDAKTGKLIDVQSVSTERAQKLGAAFGVTIPTVDLPFEPTYLFGFPTFAGTLGDDLRVVFSPATGIAMMATKSMENFVVLIEAGGGAMAWQKDGTFAIDRETSEMRCAFGEILAPIAVCRGANELAPEDIGALLRGAR